MPDLLLSADTWLFRAINSGMANPAFDAVMPVITDVRNFYPLYALLFILLIWKGGPSGRWCALLLAVTVAIADPLSSRVIKELVMRPRPCAVLHDVRQLLPCGAGKIVPLVARGQQLRGGCRRWIFLQEGVAVASISCFRYCNLTCICGSTLSGRHTRRGDDRSGGGDTCVGIVCAFESMVRCESWKLGPGQANVTRTMRDVTGFPSEHPV